jgi:hypothetical protein
MQLDIVNAKMVSLLEILISSKDVGIASLLVMVTQAVSGRANVRATYHTLVTASRSVNQ